MSLTGLQEGDSAINASNHNTVPDSSSRSGLAIRRKSDVEAEDSSSLGLVKHVVSDVSAGRRGSILAEYTCIPEWVVMQTRSRGQSSLWESFTMADPIFGETGNETTVVYWRGVFSVAGRRKIFS